MPGASRNGYTFDGWTKTKDSCFSPIKKGSTPTITSDVKYYACWTEKSSDNGNNNGTPTNETYTGTFMNDSTQFATTTCTTSGGNSCKIFCNLTCSNSLLSPYLNISMKSIHFDLYGQVSLTCIEYFEKLA